MTQISIYINFAGNAEEAFNFYKSVLGGEFSQVMRWREMPASSDFTVPKEKEDKIMHIALPINDLSQLMGGDRIESDNLKQGDAFNISITPNNEQEAQRIFEQLSKDGTVYMPLAPQFWGSLFGCFKDKFGVQWMIDYPLKN